MTGALIFLLQMQKENASVRVKVGAPNLKILMQNIAVDVEVSMKYDERAHFLPIRMPLPLGMNDMSDGAWPVNTHPNEFRKAKFQNAQPSA